MLVSNWNHYEERLDLMISEGSRQLEEVIDGVMNLYEREARSRMRSATPRRWREPLPFSLKEILCFSETSFAHLTRFSEG